MSWKTRAHIVISTRGYQENWRGELLDCVRSYRSKISEEGKTLQEGNINISKITTTELIEELSKRDGVLTISVGPYEGWQLKRKYHSELRDEITSEMVLVVSEKLL